MKNGITKQKSKNLNDTVSGTITRESNFTLSMYNLLLMDLINQNKKDYKEN